MQSVKDWIFEKKNQWLKIFEKFNAFKNIHLQQISVIVKGNKTKKTLKSHVIRSFHHCQNNHTKKFNWKVKKTEHFKALKPFFKLKTVKA